MTEQITPHLIVNMLEQNKELTNIILEQNKTIMEMASKQGVHIHSNNINSHNKTFNLNVFLNERCKDAMNIRDFVESLKLQLADLESVGRLGFVEGISNIIVKSLNSMDVCKRPVHCTDKKRETLYIKDEDRWERDDEHKRKMRTVIQHVAAKNTHLLHSFCEQHPECRSGSSAMSGQYDRMVLESVGGNDAHTREEHENKIIRNITKAVSLEKGGQKALLEAVAVADGAGPGGGW